jgi:hypothetical protein
MNLSTPSTSADSRERNSSLSYSEYDNGQLKSDGVGNDMSRTNAPTNETKESNHQTYKTEEIIHVPNLGQVRKFYLG